MAASRTTPSSSLRNNRRSVRTRLVLLVVLLLPLTAVAVGVATTPRATDFNCFWSGARIVLDGGDPYDSATWTAATGADVVDLFGTVRETHCPIGYGYPLTTAIALIPLGALPIAVAIVIWQAAFILGLAVGFALLAREARLGPAEALVLGILVVASQPFEYGFAGAGFGGLLVLAAGLLATSESELQQAGPVIGTLFAALKPHVMPFAVIVRLRALGSVRSIAAALAPIYVLGGASLIVDPGWPVKWVTELLGHRSDMATSGQSATLWMLSRVAGIPALGPLLMGLGIGALGIALWRARGRIERLDTIAVAIVGWAVVVSYALSGDHLPALSVTAAAVLRRGAPALTVSLFVIGGVLPWVLYGTRYDVLAYGGLEVSNALVPVALALLLAVAIGGRSPSDAGQLAQVTM